MSLEKNKAVVRSFFEALNNMKLDRLDEILAPDYVDDTLQIRGLENYKKAYAMLRKGIPDFHETVEDIIAKGDRVWALFRDTGTHKGELSVNLPSIGKVTIPPTGKKITFTAVAVWRVEKGKIKEKVPGVYDMLDFYKQLGVIEYTKKAKKIIPKTAP